MRALAVLLPITLAACAAIPLQPGAAQILVAPERPPAECKMLGEAIGSQGNSFTGGWTSDRKLIEGSRNELKNEALRMGGNYVWLQDSKTTGRWGGSGANNSTVVGIVYACPAGTGVVVSPSAPPAATAPSECEACKKIGGQ
jgi:hypothetical protein